MLVVIVEGVESLSYAKLFGICVPALMLGNYLLYWLFSRGLPRTSIPPTASPEYVSVQMKALGRNFGKPTLWLLLVATVAMCLTGVAGGLLVSDVSMILSGAFFGLCAAIAALALRALR